MLGKKLIEAVCIAGLEEYENFSALGSFTDKVL